MRQSPFANPVYSIRNRKLLAKHVTFVSQPSVAQPQQLLCRQPPTAAPSILTSMAPDQILDPIQLRVLGSLIEKEITTPENYPLSLNSLIGACNQRSSRDPVLDLTEDQVRQAIHSLEELALVTPVRDSRVPKYEHRARTVLNLRRDETAVLCLLFLRGPQTPGELRGRTERMYRFDELSDVQSVLQRLMTREPALVKVLPRQPGTKEARYAHLLSGDVETFEQPSTSSHSYAYATSPGAASSSYASDDPELKERVAQLEAEVAILTRELGELREQVESISKLLE